MSTARGRASATCRSRRRDHDRDHRRALPGRRAPVVVISRNTLIANVDGRLTARLAAIVADPERSRRQSAEAALTSTTTAMRAGSRHHSSSGSRSGGASYQSDASADLPSAVAQTAGPDTRRSAGRDALVGGPSTRQWHGVDHDRPVVGRGRGRTDTLRAGRARDRTAVTARGLPERAADRPARCRSNRPGRVASSRSRQMHRTSCAHHHRDRGRDIAALQIERSPGVQGVLGRIQDETCTCAAGDDCCGWRVSTRRPRCAAEPVDCRRTRDDDDGALPAICDQLGTTLSTAVSGNLSRSSPPREWIARLLSVLLDNACATRRVRPCQ